jgi:hypothetical protein
MKDGGIAAVRVQGFFGSLGNHDPEEVQNRG